MGHAAGSDITNTVYTTFTPDTRPEDIKNIFGDWLVNFDTTIFEILIPNLIPKVPDFGIKLEKGA